MTFDEVQKEIGLIKQSFINQVTEIGNKCDDPIEILIEQRSDNAFFRGAQKHPFDLRLKIVNCHIGLPFVMGIKSISLSQQ